MKYLLPLPVLLLAVACRVPGGAHHTELDLDVPKAWSVPEAGDTAVDPRWWAAFGSDELSAFIDEAQRHNRDLAVSAARLTSAAAQARIAGASLSPSVGVGGSASRQRTVMIGLPFPGGDVFSNTTTTYGVSLDVSWEVDFWGRLRATRMAAVEELRASAEDLRAAQLSIAAQTAKSWLAWQQALLQETLARETAESYAETADVVRIRYENGRASMLDVHRAQSDLASSRARLAARKFATEQVERQLETLLGRHPRGELSRAAVMPDVPALPAAGLPSELLQRRPDLLAAEARLRAADEYVYDARARLYPSLTLGGSVGRTSEDADDLFDADFDVWSLVANLAQPIFQGGRLRAGVDLAKGRAREAAAGYASAVLGAFFEVETALAVEEILEEYEREQARSASEAVTARNLAEERYTAGRDDLTTLLDAKRMALVGESALLDVRFQRLEARVDLFLALGGGLPIANEDAENEE